MDYPIEMKERCLGKMLAPCYVPLEDVHKESGVPVHVLVDWLKKSRQEAEAAGEYFKPMPVVDEQSASTCNRLPKPNRQQLAMQDLELGLFIHFGMDTYTGECAGNGRSAPSVFNPTDLDCRTWMETARAMGARFTVLTTRHEEGFCLWPTKTTDYSIAHSPYKGGKGDVVREFVDACRAGLILSLNEFGVNEAKPADADHEWFRRRLAEVRRLRPYFQGDFHLLTPCVFDLDSWLVYQLILPEKQEGAILAFRRPESPMTSGCFRLRGLDAAGTYTFEDADGGPALEAGGQELMEAGLTLAIETPRASRLLFYRKAKT